MNKQIQKSINDYVELYDLIQEKTGNDEVAVAILKEIGNDSRAAKISDATGEDLATDKQKNYMRDLGIEFSESITRKEASALIEQSRQS